MTDKDTPGRDEGAPAKVAAPSAPAARASGLLEWFSRREALRVAEANAAPRDLAALSRGKAALAVAARALDPASPLREGHAAALALTLYREACYWLLLAIHAKPFQQANLAGAFAESSPELLLQAAGDERALELLRSSLVQQSFIEVAQVETEQQESAARRAGAFVSALLLAAAGPSQSVSRLRRQSWLRIAATAVGVLVLGLAVDAGVERALRTPDLALGKSWRTSTTYAGCKPAERTCGGTRTDLLFHTDEESSPWFELDLGAPTSFGSVVLVNRRDCCAERAYPVAVEVSSDATNWKEVARRSSRYSKWTAKFPTAVARYVRVRSLKKTYLHLERVEVHAR
jgi:F5/8 type C domain